MTHAFRRHTKYELSLLRPVAWPPTTHAAPTLWERAKAMFAVMLETITSAASLAQRQLRRTERRNLIARLAPVEKLTRMLLMIEAITFLLMTPEGARLRRETPKCTPPTPKVKAAPHKITIAMPGWHTIAALRPRIDPRVVEREQREALARLIAEANAQATTPPQDTADDPSHWRCRFNIIRWTMPAPETPARKTRRVWATSLADDPHYPLLRAARAETLTPDDDSDDKPCALARRVEALARVLANPAATIRRLARRLASLPHGTLEAPYLRTMHVSTWWHGVPENYNALALNRPAHRALERALLPLPEPG